MSPAPLVFLLPPWHVFPWRLAPGPGQPVFFVASIRRGPVFLLAFLPTQALWPAGARVVPPVLLSFSSARLRSFLVRAASLWRPFRLPRVQGAFPALLSLPEAPHFRIPLPIRHLFGVLRHSPLCGCAPSINRW